MEEWNSAEVPSCRGSSQWINGYADNRSGFGEEDDINTADIGERERESLCWCSLCCEAQDET